MLGSLPEGGRGDDPGNGASRNPRHAVRPIAHQQARTSIAEARALGIDASEVLTTVAMRVAGGYALMAIPATCRLDMHLVRAAVGDRHARLSTEEELLVGNDDVIFTPTSPPTTATTA